MSAPNAAIPYERQTTSRSNRTCGAACLSMVYRSFGLDVPQTEISPAVTKPNRFGSVASTTHLMAQDALKRGLAAVAIQARHPLQALQLCRDAGIRAILNHRLSHHVATGHYTVLVGIDDKDVILHDPYFGPSRHLTHAELLELWQPRQSSSEIAGNFLIGIAADPPEKRACDVCETPIPSSVECPKCAKPISLKPRALLGCVTAACVARLWNYICCPSCDFTWTFSVQAPIGATAASAASGDRSQMPASESREDVFKLAPVFAELDKFCSHLLSLPVVAAHPEIKKQIDFMLASREKLKLAEAEELGHQKTRADQIAKLQQESAQRAEAHRKQMEELETPSPPLDSEALARALLRNLGLPDWR